MEKDYVVIGENYIIMTQDYTQKLGRGAFADVYRCKKLVDGVPSDEYYVAKEIHLQRSIPKIKELIMREIALMFELIGDDSSTVKIFDHFMGKTGNVIYIIMEYCEGGDLDAYADKNGPFTEREVAEFLYPIAKSFVNMHSRGIIHRDLKLANILLGKKMEKGAKPIIKIADLGLAYEMEEHNSPQTICGTPLNMAPELWGSGRRKYTEKVDVWAFGSMLYKMIYGIYIFEKAKVEVKIQEGIIRFPRVRLTSLEAFDLMVKCLRKNPTERISFENILSHPFFTKKSFKAFDKVFDGYFGNFEIDINKTYDLLQDPNCLGITNPVKTAFIKHNEEIINDWIELKQNQ